MAIDKNVYLSEDGNLVKFQMEVTKDKSGKVTSPTHVINCEIDVTGVTREQMLSNCFSGQSMRVKIQNSKLRPLPEGKLADIARKGYKVKWADIEARSTIVTQKSARDQLLDLSKEDFINLMVEDYDLPPERAETMYNIKHGIPVAKPEGE